MPAGFADTGEVPMPGAGKGVPTDLGETSRNGQPELIGKPVKGQGNETGKGSQQ